MFKRTAVTLFSSVFSLFNRFNMFYAVAKGRTSGIFSTWAECEAQVKGFPGAKFKKFSTREEAEDFVGIVGSSFTNLSTENLPGQSLGGYNPAATRAYTSLRSSTCYYAVARGKRVGVYSTWLECKAQVDDFAYPKFKKFPTLEEAEEFIRNNQKAGGVSSSGMVAKSTWLLAPSAPRLDPSTRNLSTGGTSSSGRTARSTKLLTFDEIPSFHRSLSTVTYSDYPFQRDDSGYVHCYTDGACESNGRAAARAGIGVWFGLDHPKNVSEPVMGPPTNNVAEIEAATKAIRIAKCCGIDKLQINTDSQFLISCVKEWMPRWRTNGWKLSSGGDVKNREQLVDLQDALESTRVQVNWNYVKAHCGIEGNEQADTLAKAGATQYVIKKKRMAGNSDSLSSLRFKPY